MIIQMFRALQNVFVSPILYIFDLSVCLSASLPPSFPPSLCLHSPFLNFPVISQNVSCVPNFSKVATRPFKFFSWGLIPSSHMQNLSPFQKHKHRLFLSPCLVNYISHWKSRYDSSGVDWAFDPIKHVVCRRRGDMPHIKVGAWRGKSTKLR